MPIKPRKTRKKFTAEPIKPAVLHYLTTGRDDHPGPGEWETYAIKYELNGESIRSAWMKYKDQIMKTWKGSAKPWAAQFE